MNPIITLSDWCEAFTEEAMSSEHVFWVRSIDYQQQLFLSPSFEKVWGLPNDLLLNHPQAFSDFIVSDNCERLRKTWQIRHDEMPSGEALYKIKSHRPDGTYIRDKFMTICDHQGNPIAAAGVAMDVTAEMSKKNAEEQTEMACQQMANQLKQKLKLLIKPSQVLTPSLTDSNDHFSNQLLSRREKQCGQWLLQGYSAKQTAEQLQISPRTVEKHLESLKDKLACQKKFEVIKVLLDYPMLLR